jgi:hypothetical protein
MEKKNSPQKKGECTRQYSGSKNGSTSQSAPAEVGKLCHARNGHAPGKYRRCLSEPKPQVWPKQTIF